MLETQAGADQPLGAYDIITRLAAADGRVAPPTVYRALDFLVGQSFAHRVYSKSVFVVCRAGDVPHHAALHLCRACGRVVEVPCDLLDHQVVARAVGASFSVETLAVEVRGPCDACSERARSGAAFSAAFAAKWRRPD